MAEETNIDGDATKQEQNQSRKQAATLQPEEKNNKYSFSSYHMNIISGNKQVQTSPTNPMLCQQQSPTDFVNYYPQQMYQPQMQPQFMQTDLHQLLNNMYMALSNQSKLLAYLVEKNEMNIQTTTKIYEEMTNKKQQHWRFRKQQGEKSSTLVNIPYQTPVNSDITANDLVSILYGPKITFKFKLIVDREFPIDKTLYRQRNFKLKINLIDDNNQIFANSNKIPISLALYTVENPPKFLQSNTLGNKMLKGYTEQDLIGGACTFQKIQIKEVTSHYRKGMLFLVAFSKMPTFGCIHDEFYVDYSLIRPLVIDKVVVKAKKVKEGGPNPVKEGGNLKEADKESERILMNENSD